MECLSFHLPLLCSLLDNELRLIARGFPGVDGGEERAAVARRLLG